MASCPRVPALPDQFPDTGSTAEPRSPDGMAWCDALLPLEERWRESGRSPRSPTRNRPDLSSFVHDGSLGPVDAPPRGACRHGRSSALVTAEPCAGTKVLPRGAEAGPQRSADPSSRFVRHRPAVRVGSSAPPEDVHHARGARRWCERDGGGTHPGRLPGSVLYWSLLLPGMTPGWVRRRSAARRSAGDPWLCVPASRLVCPDRVIVRERRTIPTKSQKANRGANDDGAASVSSRLFATSSRLDASERHPSRDPPRIEFREGASAREALASGVAQRAVDREEPVEDAAELGQPDHVRSVRGRVVRVGVNLEEQSVHQTRGHRGAREHRR